MWPGKILLPCATLGIKEECNWYSQGSLSLRKSKTWVIWNFLEKINRQYALASILLVYALYISLEAFPIEIVALFFKVTPRFILWSKLTFLLRFDSDVCFRGCYIYWGSRGRGVTDSVKMTGGNLVITEDIFIHLTFIEHLLLARQCVQSNICGSDLLPHSTILQTSCVG